MKTYTAGGDQSRIHNESDRLELEKHINYLQQLLINGDTDQQSENKKESLLISIF